jgi:hypothetical protein
MSDPFGCAKFLLGVAWTGIVFWFFSNLVHFHSGRDLLPVAIMFTSGMLGWLPFELHVETKNHIGGTFALCFLAFAVLIIGLIIVEPLIMPWRPPNTPLSPLRVALAPTRQLLMLH